MHMLPTALCVRVYMPLNIEPTKLAAVRSESAFHVDCCLLLAKATLCRSVARLPALIPSSVY
jgi:hypothetical protein